VIPSADIDQVLLFFCEEGWHKVARIVGKTLVVFEERGLRITAQEIDDRMATLVGSGQLEAQGNIRNWRYSEVRKPT
jgi:hypothetical protein